MPFLKFSRDRRGYEHFYLIEPLPARRGKTRQRVLYWFRTPPNVRVGREPFDERVMRALEAQNPGIRFDWDKLRNTPIPSAEPEYWRERRRAERAARQAQAEDEIETTTVAAVDPPTAEPTTDAQPADVAEPAADAVLAPSSEMPADRVVAGTVPPGRRRRRRRRRGQGNRAASAEPAVAGSSQTEHSNGASTQSNGLNGLPQDSSNDEPEDI